MNAVVPVPARLRPHVRRQVRGFYVGLLAWTLAAGTAFAALVGATAVGPLVGGLVGNALAERWRWWRRREQYLTEIEARAALRTGSEPRPELRAAVQREARQAVRELPVVAAVLCVTPGILALACVVAAAMRDDVLVALPAVPCVAFAAWALVRCRDARARARRWLADHPAPALEGLP